MNKFEIIITSPPDRERLVAEIWFDNMFWAELCQEQESGPFVIQFYSHPNAEHWEFPLNDAIEALQQAKKKMQMLDVPRDFS